MNPEGNYSGVTPGTEGSSDPDEEPRPRILCRYGIHCGWFPIGGMRLEDARLLLDPLLEIDPKAKAVIAGTIVGDDFVITGNVELLSFVKHASIMGG